MARNTKEEALVTRSRILDAAEILFQQHGVSGTSLQAIALAAGVTRGAVYWHFADKAAIFNAMMQRVCMPIEKTSTLLTDHESGEPLVMLRTLLVGVFERVANDAQVRRVFEVATQKVEYVDELLAVRERHLQIRTEHVGQLEGLLKRAQSSGVAASEPGARQMAFALHALLDGLIQNWILEPGAFDLLRVGQHAVDAQLRGLIDRSATPG